MNILQFWKFASKAMKSAAGNSNTVADQNPDAMEKARRIEDSICSVITNVASAPATNSNSMAVNEFVRGQSTGSFSIPSINSNSGGALNNEFSSAVISKHRSLASSLPSLTGVMVNSSLSSLSSPSAAAASLNISRPGASTMTTTSTRSSRHLQLVGDLPENVLETSCTPPSSPSKMASGHQQAVSTTAPVFASLTPVTVGIDSGHAPNSDCASTNNLGLMSPTAVGDPSHHSTISSSSTLGAVFSANNTATALTQLFPMVTASATTAISPAYLAVKVSYFFKSIREQVRYLFF